MKITKIYLILFVCVAVFLAFTAYNSNQTSESKIYTQSAKGKDNKNLKFNHAKHVKELEMKCVDCHSAVASSSSLMGNLTPQHEVCATCHEVKKKDECKLCHTDENYKTPEKYDKELNFSHKKHIEENKMQCADCHAGLEKITSAGEKIAGVFPAMESCYSCHNNDKASNNCESCHQNLTNLIPKDHKTSNFLNEHKIATAPGESMSNNCMMCHSDNFCQSCHSPTKFKGDNTKTNFYAPYYNKETGVRTDRGKLQQLTTIHNLNYKFTHGLDANQKSFECKTCHTTTEFCASCHTNGGEMITGLAPNSHKQPNFTTIGVNTGGGLHSTLAKKDIESCQSCHATESADPVCVKCHFDNDGIKSTNPKTHESGFMRDEKGIFHNTKGANCYVCHTDANARPDGKPGVGFCGYCHGEKK